MAIRTTERQAVLSSIAGGATLAELVERTGVEYAKVRHALGYFVRANMVTYTTTRRPHCRRPVAVYKPAAPEPDLLTQSTTTGPAWTALAQAWRSQ